MKLIDSLYFVQTGGDSASSTMPLHGHPETPFNRAKQQKGGPDKGGVAGAKRKKTKKKALTATSGGQSGGSSLIARNFKVVDGMGRELNSYTTKEEAQRASAGIRYSRVVSAIPESDTPKVRDMKKTSGDTKVRVFRQTEPFPNPLPSAPSGR